MRQRDIWTNYWRYGSILFNPILFRFSLFPLPRPSSEASEAHWPGTMVLTVQLIAGCIVQVT